MPNDPLLVECPRCGARPRWTCKTVSDTGNWHARTHRARWKAIGIAKPTDDQWDEAHVHAKAHRAALLLEFSEQQARRYAALTHEKQRD